MFFFLPEPDLLPLLLVDFPAELFEAFPLAVPDFLELDAALPDAALLDPELLEPDLWEVVWVVDAFLRCCAEASVGTPLHITASINRSICSNFFIVQGSFC
jgi:hypothetical protein